MTSTADVMVPGNLVDAMVDAADTAALTGGKPVASMTAWSNNASNFSVPNVDADRFLADQHTVDQLATTLADEFNDTTTELPVGMGFCLGVSTAAMKGVGVMDPVFGRGYCEEVDWCCRATSAGWRHVLATNTFVYHMGSATTRLAGLLAPGEQTVQVNEAIIDERHPDYRRRVSTWESTGGIDAEVTRAVRRIVSDASRKRGYILEATWLPKNPTLTESTLQERAHIIVTPDGNGPLVEAAVDGFRAPIDVGADGILAAVASFVGVAPAEVRISDHGSVASQLETAARAAGVREERTIRYPERV